MSPNNASHQTASPVARLSEEYAAWQALLQTLQEEEQALVDGDADRLASLSATKLARLQAVSDHARNRHSDLLAAGHTPDRAGMGTWLAQQGQPGLPTRWQQLCDMEQTAQATNQRIGALIEMRLGATRQALNVLIHAASGQGGLYDNEGLAVAARKGKPLTAA
jgi:flagella synthesis protein FlgN